MSEKNKKWLYPLLEMIAVIAITIGIFKFVVIPVRIDGISMENTLHDQSIAMINAIGVSEENIHRFDVVVIYSEALKEKIIKRVIGMPGDTVEFKDDILYINNQQMNQDFLDQDFVDESKITYNAQNFTDDFKVTVSDEEYFVMGDNRLRSTDSRDLGTFRINDIIGVKGLVIFPFDEIQWIQ
ncbi:signal peptidase I [Candidatus Stoquefichus massiliensis]|uniref:signal peptidase I n=1 Tax=Candidatus Stoquefichus massiliensis TaxID=1470350 RepID=UPI0004B164A7|nr:signal peptidase I [Candidatus Stoquefichus massiliensis]